MAKKLKIGMAVGPLFEDLEFWAVYMRVKEFGAEVITVGSQSGETYKSKSGGLTATAEISYENFDFRNYDAFLVPGGFAPDKIRRSSAALSIVREMHDQGKLLGFICHAGWVAASAGIVKGQKCTGSLGIKDDLVNAGGLWVDEPAFTDKNVVWGRVVADIPDYNRELIAELTKRAGS